MARWLVTVVGDRFDLEELPAGFPSGDVHAVAEGEAVFLTGPAFEAMTKPAEILDAAAQALSERCAILALLWPSFQAPSVGVVIREDDEGRRLVNHILRCKVGAFRLKSERRSVFPGQGDQSGPTDAQRLLAASSSDPHLSTALMLWADPVKSWPRLYRLVEELKMYFGGIPEDACSGNELRRFNGSANNASIAGIDSRHADGKFDAPAKPMSHDEAVGFVRGLIVEALKREDGRRRMLDSDRLG